MAQFPASDGNAYTPPTLLWTLVQRYVPVSQLEEVKDMLGTSLVDSNLELHLELTTLYDIWTDYKRDIIKQQSENNYRLPEPPECRERLVQEICFLLDNVQEKAKLLGHSHQETMKKYDDNVIDYALNRSRSSSRMFTLSSTSLIERHSDASRISISERESRTAKLSEGLESMNDQLSYLKLEKVVQHLRDTLEEENIQLKDDIILLQRFLDDESDFESTIVLNREPSLADLREHRNKLEKDVNASQPCLPVSDSRRKSSMGSLNSAKVKPILRQGSTRCDTTMDTSHTTEALAFLDIDSAKARRRISTCENVAEDVELNAQADSFIPTHVIVRNPSAMQSQLFTVSNPALKTQIGSKSMGFHVNAVKQARPNSASRFRNMVLSCRDS